MSFGFRLKFALPPAIALGIDASSWTVESPGGKPRVTLQSGQEGWPIKACRSLLLCGQDYTSLQDAQDAGNYYRDIFMLASAYLHLGFNFGRHSQQENPAVQYLDDKSGRPLLDDVCGLYVYAGDPQPLFVDQSGDHLTQKPQERFERVLRHMIQEQPHMTDQGRLAYDLFSSSFYQNSPESRFLMLMQAMLILQIQQLRSAMSVAHVDQLIEKTSRCQDLTASEQATLAVALEHLKTESIIQGGCRLAEYLGTREYGNLPGRTFWLRCAALKGRLTQGPAVRVSSEEFELMNPPLEMMVGDLLCILPYIKESPERAKTASAARKPASRQPAELQPAPHQG